MPNYQNDAAGNTEAIRNNLTDRYSRVTDIFPELIQNADDAGASRLDLWLCQGVSDASHQLLRIPAVVAVNDGLFTQEDEKGIRRLNLSGKSFRPGYIGRFGLGLKSVFHLGDAYFYAHGDLSVGMSISPRGEVLSPLFGTCADDETARFQEWDSFEESDLQRISATVQGLGYQGHWFCIWIPLRQRRLSGDGAIVQDYWGDNVPKHLAEQLPENFGSWAATLLPLLKSLGVLRVWESAPTGLPHPWTEVALQPGSQQRRHLPKEIFTGSGPITGSVIVEESDGKKAEYQYYGQETTLDQKEVIDSGQVAGRGIITPHTAAVLLRFPGKATQKHQPLGRWHTFLPLSGDESAFGHVPVSNSRGYYLALHGFFSIDPGRRRVEFAEGVTSPANEREAKALWNTNLRDKGTLPNVLKALDRLQATGAPSLEEMRELTGLIQKELTAHREALCSEGQWVCRWNASTISWGVIGPHEAILTIPAGENPSLPAQVLPELTNLARQHVVTYSDWPLLSGHDPIQWSTEQLRLLIDSVPLEVLQGEEKLSYLAQFLESQRVAVSEPSFQEALMNLVRKALTGLSLKELQASAGGLTRLLKLLDSARCFYLPRDNRVPSFFSEANKQVPDLLVLPLDVQPGIETRPGSVVSRTAAVNLLQVLARCTGGNGAPDVYLKSILEACGSERASVLTACSDLPLLRAQNLRENKEVTLTWTDLEQAEEDHLLFRRAAGNRPELERELQKALRGSAVLTITAEVADAVAETRARIPTCAPSACVEAVRAGMALADPDGCLQLLQALINRRNEVADPKAWRAVVRYLLHGDQSHLESEEALFIPVDGDSTEHSNVWEVLSQRALGKLSGAWRVIDSGLAEHVTSALRQVVGLRPLHNASVIELLREAGPGELAFDTDDATLVSQIRETLLRSTDDVALLRDLRIHRSQHGTLVNIGKSTFLANSEFRVHQQLAKMVTLVDRSSDAFAHSRETHLKLASVWGPEEAIRLAINEDEPSLLWQAILDGLRTLKRPINSVLRDMVESRPWLPLESGGGIAPSRVLDLEGLQQVLNALVKRFPSYVVAESLNQKLRANPDFPDVRRLFPDSPEVLRILGQELSNSDAFLVGLPDLFADDSKLNDWISALEEGAPDSVMAASGLVKAVVQVEEGKYRKEAQRFLLPKLSLPLPSERYVAALNYLAERHAGQRANHERYRRVHTWYLEEAARSPTFAQDILPHLRLLNRLGVWKLATELCAGAENVSQADSLHDDHWKVLHAHLRTGSVHVDQATAGATDSVGTSAAALVQYINRWEGICPPAILGTLLAILGDEPVLRSAAEECLERGWRVEGIRDLLGWTPQPQRAQGGWIAADSLNKIMETQRFSLRLVSPNSGTKILVTNLVGDTVTASLGEQVENLIIGSLAHSPVSTPVEQERVATVSLRTIDPQRFAERAEGLIKATIQIIWRDVYFQSGSLDPVWLELGAEDQLSLRSAQELIEENLFFHMGLLRMPRNETIDALRSRWRDARNREAEVSELARLGKLTDSRLEKAKREVEAEKKKIKDDLGRLLEENVDVQEAFHQAVQQTVKDAGYRSDSVPLELFQNADDATLQLSYMQDQLPVGRFVAVATPNRLTFVHWGRRINVFKTKKYRDQRFANDLENMLVMHASDKSSGREPQAVTGKFGLGFKSVFLVTKHPRVLSGDIGFEVVGGVYPRALSPDARRELIQRVKAIGLDHHDATIIDLPLAGTVIPGSVLSRFQRSAGVLHAFARTIRASEVNDAGERHSRLWQPMPVAEVPGMEVGRIELAEGTRFAIVFRAPDNEAVLMSLNGWGVEALPADIPTIWVTAPTGELGQIGIALNAMFAVGPGRANLADQAEANTLVARSLGQFLGQSMVALASASRADWDKMRKILGLAQDISAYNFWGSMWELLGRRLSEVRRQDSANRAVHIGHQVLWAADTGTMPRLLATQPVLPSMLPGDYRVLCALKEVRYAVAGVLDHDEVFTEVARWPSFRARYAPGSIVSSEIVACPLQSLMSENVPPAAISIKSALQAELKDLRATPEEAEVVGRTIDADLLKKMEEGNLESRSERAEILSLLGSLKFLARSGSWVLSDHLVIADAALATNKDESLRAAFAPEGNILSSHYHQTGVHFFKLCRGELSADTEEMTSWALGTDDAAKREAVLRYLLRGELGREVGQLLRSQFEVTWLATLSNDSPHLAPFDLQERVQLLGLLGLYRPEHPIPWPQPSLEPPRVDPGQTLEAIAKWWQEEGAQHVRAYESSIYPDGRMPTLIVDLDVLSSDVDARQAWLELFILGATFTMGRTQPEQHAAFIRRWREKGWLRQFADPGTPRQRWIQILEEYFQDGTDRLDYFHWLRLFVSICQFSMWLDEYIGLFLDLEKRDSFVLHAALMPRQDSTYQGSGMDAPSLVPALGFGACFIVRELVRQGTLTSGHVLPYCYVPQAQVRRFLEGLGCGGLEDEIRTERSPRIYQFLRSHLADRATFGGAFDIPLLLASANDGLWGRFLGEERPTDIEESDEE